MSEETKQPEGGVPPKLDLRKSGVVPGVPQAPSGEQAAAGAQGGTEPTAAGKKKTTRIPLPGAEGEPSAEAAAGALPKTVRLATPPGAAKPSPAIPVEPAAAKPTPAGEGADRAKRETSRIPLEAAFAPEGQAATGTAGAPAAIPKTIRIKRPGQAPALKVPRAPEEQVAEVPGAGKRKTARLDVGVAPEAGPPTQRKTIKIRRAEGGAVAPPRSVAVARLEAEAAERHLEEISAPGIVYSIVALAAVLVACALIYMLMAQAFPTLNLSLPGKIGL